MNKELLVIKNISKSYDGVQALDGVSMDIKEGEIHSLVGENGSGKSTLIKIIGGVVKPDRGDIIINGKQYTNLHVIDSIREGIQIIYQDLSLFPNLTVTENISMNQMIERKRKYINWKEVEEIASRELKSIGKELYLDEIVENLSIANKQLVAITRALTQGAKLIVMDEPTTAITKSEIDSLFSIILKLKNRGISTLFVSHKLCEVLEISEKVTILRDGKKVGEFKAKALNDEKLVYHMTGKKMEYSDFKFKGKKEKPLLEVKNLTKKGDFEDISFKLQAGEIIGITGILGSGRTELALSIFGLNRADSGEIYVSGKSVKINSIKNALNLGISYLPENRLEQGLFIEQAIDNNIIVTILKEILNKFKLISSRKKKKCVEKWAEELRIKTPSLSALAGSLSGGNQQRVVLAKWLATNPKIFLLDSATVGIDIASKSEIHNIIRELANEGMGIIMISDEIPEVIHNCNRILIMRSGRIIDEVDAGSITEEELFNKVSQIRKTKNAKQYLNNIRS
jgi:simple sugar transport system ATP-binding protein